MVVYTIHAWGQCKLCFSPSITHARCVYRYLYTYICIYVCVAMSSVSVMSCCAELCLLPVMGAPSVDP